MKSFRCDNVLSFQECAVIVISGDITNGDGVEFIERTKEVVSATIVLSGPGGSFRSSIAIGTTIFKRKYRTYVPKDAVCASACANIWLAGNDKRTGPGSMIVFHTPYNADDPTHADGAASVMQGIYLAALGYSYKQAAELFGHGPLNTRAYVVDDTGEGVFVTCYDDIYFNKRTCK